jgi:hypothetical protein
MKHLTVAIRAELEVPDDWELVDHPSGMQVLKIGDNYVDCDLAPLATTSDDPDAEWSYLDTRFYRGSTIRSSLNNAYRSQSD